MKSTKLLLIFPILAAFLLLSGCKSSVSDEGKNLFNGTDLQGWVQLGGEAIYTVEEGEIVGRTVLNTPNSFLCTEEHFGDFILEMEIKVHPDLNSGVQIRSHSSPDYLNGSVHGYQVEVDPSPRAWSAGIYDEARRGWIYNLSRNEAARAAFKNNDWNHYRIEAIGNTIKTWINGVPAAWLVDDLDSTGFIGLQVHSVPNDPEKEGLEARFRNITIKTVKLESFVSQDDMNIPQVNLIPHQLTDYEIMSGWKLLFDGQSINNWRGVCKKKFPKKRWAIGDGVLKLSAKTKQNKGGGDIVTKQQFTNFDLIVEFKITEAANSGIKYFVVEDCDKKWAFGPEYQILDDRNHPDAKEGKDGNRTMASLYDLIPAQNKRVRPVGEWNIARIIADGNKVEHWLNGIKVFDYERESESFRLFVGDSKFSAEKYNVSVPFGESESGHILLQDHGDEVAFRSIKVREW